MNTPPRLSEADIRVEVESIFRKKHRSRLVALFGCGEPAQFEWDGKAWEVRPTTCELDLRSQLPRPQEAQAGKGRVFLVDWADDALPLDVACRLAGGRVYHIARDTRLAGLFGARQVEPGLASTALARLLLSGSVTGLRKVSGMRLMKADAWRRFLYARLDLGEEALADPIALLKWARCNQGGPAFVRQCESEDVLRAVRRELLAWLGEHDSLRALAWRAWETSQVDRVLQVTAICQAARGEQDPYLRGLVGGLVGGWLPQVAPEFRAAEAALAEGGLLAALLEPEHDRRLLEDAQALAVAGGLASLATASEWLPAGHAAREQAFAAQLVQFVDEPTGPGLDAMRDALDRLKAHRLDGLLRTSENRSACLMAVRLAAWLLGRTVRPPIALYQSTWQAAVDLARQYAEEGGHLDWARQTLRAMRGASAPLEGAVRRVLAKVEQVAREDDRRFADAYVSWLDAGKPGAEVVPIAHVAKRIVAPFLDGGPHRKLLFVLMDGMSQTSAAQLLHRLQEQRRWRPLKWSMPGGRGSLPIPPVLAAAPTLTAVSRSALFAGTEDPRFGDQGTDRDAARWGSNPHLRELLAGDLPAFFVRRDIHAGHELAEDVKAAVASDQRLVAAIINAVDDQLSGSFQVGVDYSLNQIHPLEALLSAAEGAERAVLLVADHGHVLGDALRVLSGRVGGGREHGARWRALNEGEQPEPDEVRLPQSCWKPRQAAGVAVLWDSSVAYKAPNLGEHGGLSLMEAVAPAILIGPEWLAQVAGEDADLGTRPIPVPGWWDLRVARPAPITPAAPTRRADPAQLTLISTPVLEQAIPVAEDTLLRKLRESKAFREHVRLQPPREIERVLGWLQLLVPAGGTLPANEFARLCEKRPHQVGGIVAQMGLLLNADGFAIVEHDLAGHRVVFHKARLLQQYGVEG